MNRLVDLIYRRDYKDLLEYDGVIIYGMGSHFDEVYEFLKELSISILAVCDNNPDKQGDTFLPIRILSPAEALKLYKRNHTAFVLGVVSFQREIYECLTSEFEVATEDVFSFLSPFSAKYMYDVASICRDSEAVVDACSILSDEESKRTYYNILNAKLTMSPKYLIQNPLMHAPYEYVVSATEKIPYACNDVIIDCGAYVGDTADFFLKKYPNLSEIVCIEPLRSNYDRIAEFAGMNNLNKKIRTVHAAVGEKPGTTVIKADDEVSVSATTDSKVENANISESVQVVTLDELSSDYKKVDFIKFDIEGMELEALRGGVEMMKRFSPCMMVSAYHRTSHLWEIPLFVHKNIPNSRIYLGHQINAPFEPEYYIVIGRND